MAKRSKITSMAKNDANDKKTWDWESSEHDCKESCDFEKLLSLFFGDSQTTSNLKSLSMSSLEVRDYPLLFGGVLR